MTKAILTASRFDMIERLLMALWIGGLCIVGYLVAPILFATLEDRQLAGMLAGKLFSAISWVGLVIGGTLTVACLVTEGGAWLRQWRAWAMVAILAIVVSMLFVVQPMMADLKSQGPAIPGSDLAAAFGRLHGISSGLYLVMSLLGLALVALGLRRRS